jgi:large repetitive protein
VKIHKSKFKSMSIFAIIATMDLLLSGQGMQVFAAGTSYPTSQISGKVTLYSSSLGVPNATVIVLDGSTNIIGEATSGSDGSYNITYPQSETPATIKAEAVGYQEYNEPASGSSGNGANDISLIGQGNVAGEIVDQSNSPVSGATISIVDKSGNTLASTTSASDGSYSLNGVPAGIITIQASIRRVVVDTETEDVNTTSTSTVKLNANLSYATIQGTITDGKNNNVSGATISLINGSGTVVQTVNTSANGTYSISNVIPGQYSVQVSASGYQTVTQNETVGNAQTVQANVMLQAGTNSNSSPSITGIVTDSITGKPVAGVTVTVKNSSGTVVGANTTGFDGSYTISGLSAGSYSETLSANNYQTANQSNITVSTGEPTAMKNTITPYTGKCLGVVSYLDSNNASHPVSGAQVSILDPNTGNAIVQPVTTDANGNYSMSNIPIGTYSVEVQAANFADSVTQDVAITNGQTAVEDIHLSTDYGKVAVKVIDKATNIPVNANVQILDSIGNPVTGSIPVSGQYTFTNVQTGNLTVVVDANGYIESETPIVVSSKQAAEADVALATGNVTVTGTITSAADNSPIAGATVEALNDNSSIIASVDTGADGTYSLAGVPSDGCTLRVVADGYTESQQTLTSVDSSTKEDVQLEKKPFSGLQGLVEDSSATPNPIAGAKVTLLSDTGNPTGQVATTDGNGNYSFTGLSQDSMFSIQIGANGYVSKTIVGVPTGSQNVQLKAATGTVFGTVSDGSGNPVGSYTVDMISSTGTFLSTDYSGDADGSFKFYDVPVGTYSVKVKIFGNVVASKTNQLVTNGETTTENIVLTNATGTIFGSVVDSATQNAISGAKISLLDGNGKQVGNVVASQANGTFEIQNVPAGNYTLQASTTGYNADPVGVSVPVAGTIQPKISMAQNGATVSGLVKSSDGVVSGASVSLVNSLGRIVGTVAQTNANGVYQFTNIPLGTYTIEVYDKNYQSISVPDQVIGSGTNTISDIQLATLTQSNYNGTVVDQAGNPMSAATITLLDSKNNVVKITSTAADGSFSLQNISKKVAFTIVVRANGYYTYTGSFNWSTSPIVMHPVE